MPHYTPADAELFVFTFKDGLLSKVAHDLKLRAARFDIDVDPAAAKIAASIDPSSLEVVAVMRDGNEDPSGLSASDKEKIAAQIRDEVLETSRHPSLTFTSSSVERRPDGTYRVTGDLGLHGVTRPLQLETRLEQGRQVAEVELHQPDFGVVPFKAMMGTLKVKPLVRVRVSIPNA